MLKVKEYSSFEAFEQDEHRQDVDLVAIVNKPNGMVCADLMHNDLCVDTKMYDATLFDLWLAVSLERRRALRIFRFSEFDSWMSQWLV